MDRETTGAGRVLSGGYSVTEKALIRSHLFISPIVDLFTWIIARDASIFALIRREFHPPAALPRRES